jgi:hypothetical protein
MKHGLALMVVAIAFVLVGVPYAKAADDEETRPCSAATLKGGFGFTATGTFSDVSGPLVGRPFAAVGRVTFDGQGGASGIQTFNRNGVIVQNVPFTVTYTINPDCTGIFAGTFFVVDDHGKEYRAIPLTPGLVQTYVGRKISAGDQ